MSRIGKKPVPVPAGVTAEIEGKTLSVKGPKGTLTMGLEEEVTYAVEDGKISEGRFVSDSLGLLTQLGVTVTPPSLQK